MPTLVIPKTYAANRSPRVGDLDNIRLTIEACFNNTKVDADNVNLSDVSSAITAAQAQTIISTAGTGSVVQSSFVSSPSTVGFTIPTSGVYLISFGTQRMTGAQGSGFPPAATASLSSSGSVSISVNGVTLYTYARTFAFNTSGSDFRSIVNTATIPWSVVRSFTEGDVITSTYQGELVVTKLLEI